MPLLVYLGGWYIGKWIGNFSLLLFMLTLVTLAYWLAERFHFKPRARPPPPTLEHARRRAPRRAGATWASPRSTATLRRRARRVLAQPWWLDWTAGLFPVILVVFLLRSFLFEPFKIPSGSMIPTLLVGDLILVNKYHYGVRLPVINKKIIANNDPQRGDVMVFRYPEGPAHRLHQACRRRAGRRGRLPNQQLTINGKPVPRTCAARLLRRGLAALRAAVHREARAASSTASWSTASASRSYPGTDTAFPYSENCRYSAEGVTCKVPPATTS